MLLPVGSGLSYVARVRIAFKEWAVVVDALGRGEQIVILRKGGLDEGRSGFAVEHNRFLLFPTRFHQQGEAVVPEAKARFEKLNAAGSPDVVRIEFLAEVVDWRRVESLEAALRLRGQHIWRDEVIRERFEWGQSRSIYALALRVFRLPLPVERPMLERYGGCRSWVEVDPIVATDGAKPVLTDGEFSARLESFERALAIAEGNER